MSFAVALSLVLTLATSPCRAQHQAAETQPVSSLHLAGGLLTITAGLGLAAAGAYAIVRIDEIQSEPDYQRFQQGVPPSLDTCGAARDGVANFDYRLLNGAALPSDMAARCDEIDTLVAVELIAFPTALILAGLGSYLVAEAFGEGYDDSRGSLKVEPVIGPGYAGVSGTF